MNSAKRLQSVASGDSIDALTAVQERLILQRVNAKSLKVREVKLKPNGTKLIFFDFDKRFETYIAKLDVNGDLKSVFSLQYEFEDFEGEKERMALALHLDLDDPKMLTSLPAQELLPFYKFEYQKKQYRVIDENIHRDYVVGFLRAWANGGNMNAYSRCPIVGPILREIELSNAEFLARYLDIDRGADITALNAVIHARGDRKEGGALSILKLLDPNLIGDLFSDIVELTGWCRLYSSDGREHSVGNYTIFSL